MEKSNNKNRISWQFWLVIWVAGIAGQLVWSIENQWFNTFVYDTDDVFCVWQNSLSENNVVNIQLDFFCAMENGKDYRRYSENFSERAYSHEEIEEMLHNSGFETAAVYGDLSFEPPKPEEQRIIYVARKVK